MVAVCAECCRTAGILGQKIRTHHFATPWTPLAESSGEDKVLALCSGLPMPSWYSATVPRIWQPAVVPAVACVLLTRQHWSFQLRDDRLWETVRFQLLLPVHGTLCHPLAAFCHQLKTVLFRTSFGEDANTWGASLSTRDCFSVC